jgi:hypothetical protein
MAKPTLIGLAWYRRQDWGRVRQAFTDRDALDDTFDAWEAGARKVERTLKRQGLAVKRVVIDLDEFLGWCVLQGLEPVAAARSKFVTEKLRRDFGPKSDT